LRKQDIKKIVDAFDDYRDQDKYCRIVGIKELEENDFNLNVRRYVDSSEEEKKIDVSEVVKDIKRIEEEKKKIDDKVKEFLKEFKYIN